MKKIHCLNPIAKCGTELFPAGYEMTDKAADADAVLVRSASMRGYGAARAKSILYEKGIPKELWDEALEDLPEMDGAIDTFLRRKLDGRTLDAKQIKKTVDALLRRGHSYHDIQAGLRRYEASLSLEQTQEDTWEDME